MQSEVVSIDIITNLIISPRIMNNADGNWFHLADRNSECLKENYISAHSSDANVFCSIPGFSN